MLQKARLPMSSLQAASMTRVARNERSLTTALSHACLARTCSDTSTILSTTLISRFLRTHLPSPADFFPYFASCAGANKHHICLAQSGYTRHDISTTTNCYIHHTCYDSHDLCYNLRLTILLPSMLRLTLHESC